MKNLLLISLILFTVLIPNISQSSNFTLLNPVGVEDEIDLEGTLDVTSTRTPQPTPIQATINSSSLNVEFLNNLGIISVEVSSPSGSIIYNYNVNTQSQGTLSIDVSNWGSGVYQIRFVNSEGRFMYGTFEIE